MKDPYAILGVAKSASADEIRRAYRKLAKELHPDTNPGDKVAEERFKEVGQAFKLLSDAKTKARFDRGEIDASGQETAAYHFRSRPGGSAGQRGPSGRYEDISDIFSDLFSDFGGGGGRGQQNRGPQTQKGRDLKAGVTVSFEEAMRGGKRRVGLTGGRAVEVAIPAGVEAGKVLRLRGQGEPGLHGGPAGDCLVEIAVRPHPFFRRDGADIRVDLPITLKEALFGGAVRAPTVDGPVEVRVPAGANSGAQLRLRGKGAPKPSGGHGDQIIKLVVDIPMNDPTLEAFVEDWSPPSDYDPRKHLKS